MSWETVSTVTDVFTESELLSYSNEQNDESYVSLTLAIAALGVVAGAVKLGMVPVIANTVARATGSGVSVAAAIDEISAHLEDTTISDGIDMMEEAGETSLIVRTERQQWVSSSGNQITGRTVHTAYLPG